MPLRRSHQLLPSSPIPWHFSGFAGGGDKDVPFKGEHSAATQQPLLLSTLASSESMQSLLATAERHFSNYG